MMHNVLYVKEVFMKLAKKSLFWFFWFEVIIFFNFLSFDDSFLERKKKISVAQYTDFNICLQVC